jgi:hypothetical protein
VSSMISRVVSPKGKGARTKRLVQLELAGDHRFRFNVETYEDEGTAIRADDRLDVTWKGDWQKRPKPPS